MWAKASPCICGASGAFVLFGWRRWELGRRRTETASYIHGTSICVGGTGGSATSLLKGGAGGVVYKVDDAVAGRSQFVVAGSGRAR